MKEKQEQNKGSKGLQTELHPALRSSNLNLVRSKRENPYIEDTPSLINKRAPRRLGYRFYRPGEIVEYGDYLREQKALKIEEDKRKERQNLESEQLRREKIELGELPDEDEVEYIALLRSTPTIEWWDSKYMKSTGSSFKIHEKYQKTYDDLETDSEDEETDEERPSIRFIKHPVPIGNGKAAPRLLPKIYLTKKEQKKVRRNQRKIVRKEQEELIKLGQIPKPQPKVKLSNMANVYENNNSIQDPTQWEKTVREQADERRRKHYEENQRRHLEAKERKNEVGTTSSPMSDLPSTNNHCRVYKFNQLKNPKIRFRLLNNGRQLALKGCCLHINQGKGVIIIIGTEKSCRFFDRLVLVRIHWSESFVDKRSNQEIDCSGGACEKLWQGVIDSHSFRGWFMKECSSIAEVRSVIRQSAGSSLSHIEL